MDAGADGGAVDPRVVRSRTVVRQAALDELAEVGYGAFTIESVAHRAGVGKSTIYRHWPDKLAIIADAFETFHHQMVPTPETGSRHEQVTRLLAHVAEVVVDSTFSACIPALIEGAERDERVREFRRRYAAERRRALTDIIVTGVRTGEFSDDLDPELATATLLGPIFYGRLMSGEPFDPGRAGEVVAAVLGPPPRREVDVRPVGWVESALTERSAAPKQGDEGAPDAWLRFGTDVLPALDGLEVGAEVVVLTWLHCARRDVLRTHPRDDASRPELGVFATRSPDRPNPVGLHRVQIVSIQPGRILVRGLEALDGTPVIDVKPVLDRDRER